MKKNLKFHKAHSAAFAQITMDIPTTIWQTCRSCQQNFKVGDMTFVENECRHCIDDRENADAIAAVKLVYEARKAWKALQAVPSYVETQARAFAGEA